MLPPGCPLHSLDFGQSSLQYTFDWVRQVIAVDPQSRPVRRVVFRKLEREPRVSETLGRSSSSRVFNSAAEHPYVMLAGYRAHAAPEPCQPSHNGIAMCILWEFTHVCHRREQPKQLPSCELWIHSLMVGLRRRRRWLQLTRVWRSFMGYI